MNRRKIFNGKSGASLTGWTEGIILSTLVVIVLGTVILEMNGMYGDSNDLGLGTNTTTTNIKALQGSTGERIQGGEAEFTTSQGLTLKSSWEIIKTVGSTIWTFIGGGWIETIATDYMHLPAEVAVSFRILYFISVVFAILRMLFKVKP